MYNHEERIKAHYQDESEFLAERPNLRRLLELADAYDAKKSTEQPEDTQPSVEERASLALDFLNGESDDVREQGEAAWNFLNNT